MSDSKSILRVVGFLAAVVAGFLAGFFAGLVLLSARLLDLTAAERHRLCEKAARYRGEPTTVARGVWCAHDDCGWGFEVIERDDYLAEYVARGATLSHRLTTGHIETHTEAIDDE